MFKLKNNKNKKIKKIFFKSQNLKLKKIKKFT